MYGMVNNAVKDLIVEKFGTEVWQEVRADAGVDMDSFLSNDGYDDSITYDLVAAASKHLGLPAEAILEAFGEYWILETAAKNYSAMLDIAGSTLPDFIDNLPNFHARVSLMFPALEPPEFAIAEKSANSRTVIYYSHRKGLQPFLLGIFKGLGKRFDVPVEIRHTTQKNADNDHDTFEIRWS